MTDEVFYRVQLSHLNFLFNLKVLRRLGLTSKSYLICQSLFTLLCHCTQTTTGHPFSLISNLADTVIRGQAGVCQDFFTKLYPKHTLLISVTVWKFDLFTK